MIRGSSDLSLLFLLKFGMLELDLKKGAPKAHMISKTRRTTCKKICGKTQKELIEECRQLYAKHGFKGISFKRLKITNRLYYRLYRFGITQQQLIRLLGLEDEYAVHRRKSFKRRVGDKIQYRWSWERVIKEARAVFKEKGFLPPGEWFSKNGRGSLVQAVYSHNKTWADLRSQFDSFQGSSFIESRNNMRWRSHPEASLSNFLYARGIDHKIGRKYPADFAKYAKQNYGYYDLTFLSNKKKWIDVEIWGDKPLGHDEKGYAKKRLIKEKYNSSNDQFLGIQYQDCFDEKRLSLILKPYIGLIKPYIFEKATDKIIQSTHWSNTDELVEYCKDLASKSPGGKFPTEEWLRKRGKWKNRKGPALNTLAVYIKTWIGGVRKLRIILGQEEHSTVLWTRDKVLEEYKKWFDTHGLTPGAAAQRVYRGQMSLSEADYNKACCINAAVNKYIGSALDVCQILGIKLFRSKTSKFEIAEK